MAPRSTHGKKNLRARRIKRCRAMRVVLHLRPAAMAVIAGHGAADASKPPQLLACYALAALPLPQTTAAFAVASVAHFALDVGVGASLVMHCLLVHLARRRRRAACALLQAYMCTLHVPVALLGVLLRADGLALAAVTAATLATWAARHEIAPDGRLELTELLQRLIVVHVALNLHVSQFPFARRPTLVFQT